MHSLRIAVKVVITFLFSIIVLLAFATVSLFGVSARDEVRLIVTEATGLQREMVLMNFELQPLVIHNVFWLCLASLGFMLIILYLIDKKFYVFLAPGVLCLSITVFLSAVFSAALDYVLSSSEVLSTLYVQTALDRFTQAAFGMAVFGLALVALGIWGDRYIGPRLKRSGSGS